MAIEKLSARAVASKLTPGLYGDGGGLYLKVAPGGTRSWVYRYWRDGRRHALGLGSCNTITLAEARDKAREQRRLRLDGLDPKTVKQAAIVERRVAKAKAMTFEDCAAAYIQAHQAGWKTIKEAQEWTASMRTYVYPILGKLPVNAVDLSLVLRVIEPLWQTKTATGARVRQRIENILDWATVRGHRQGDNPARWKGHMEQLLPKKSKVAKVEHHAAMPYTGVSAFLAKLRDHKGIPARALEFTILTATRVGEVVGAAWTEIDFKDRVWVIPAERMKAGREHRVPLSAAALAPLESLPRVGPSIFPTTPVTVWRTAKNVSRAEITVHGFRSSFRDWAGERTGFAREVVEQCLAHAAGDQTELAYRRGDALEKRRHIMDAWADYCAGITEPAKVVPLRAATV